VSSEFYHQLRSESDLLIDADFLLRTLKDRYRCPYFRILVIGRANAGKTTILEKVCGVARGTISMIYDQNGKLS